MRERACTHRYDAESKCMLLKREALRWEADLKRKLHDVEERLAEEMKKAVFLEEKLEKLLEAFQQSTHLFFDYAESSVHKLQGAPAGAYADSNSEVKRKIAALKHSLQEAESAVSLASQLGLAGAHPSTDARRAQLNQMLDELEASRRSPTTPLHSTSPLHRAAAPVSRATVTSPAAGSSPQNAGTGCLPFICLPHAIFRLYSG
jgi:hypothetical protein